MQSKRASEEEGQSERKRLKEESSSKEETIVNFKLYTPSCIFLDNKNHPHEMAGTANVILAKSFYHCRYDDEGKLKNTGERETEFDRNAGAAQLYEKDGVTVYTIPGQENKEYNIVSYGNKHFKEFTKRQKKEKKKRSAYGHSERILMKNILDDLIMAHGDEKEIPCPSDNCTPTKEDEELFQFIRNYFPDEESKFKEYLILRNFIEEASKYKEYLIKKGKLVKMWSERPACQGVGAGKACSEFIKDIFPEGSQFGYIIKDYEPKDNKEPGQPKVKTPSTEFKEAYIKYSKSS